MPNPAADLSPVLVVDRKRGKRKLVIRRRMSTETGSRRIYRFSLPVITMHLVALEAAGQTIRRPR